MKDVGWLESLTDFADGRRWIGLGKERWMERTEREYHAAVGRCLNAAIALRRFDGRDALEELRAAIRVIEQEQQRSAREERLRHRIVAPPPPRDYPIDEPF